jgi:hypothetical protein
MLFFVELWHLECPFSARGSQFPLLQCDNPNCKSKGKRVKVRRCKQGAHGFDLKSRRGAKSVFEGAPKVFR